MGLGLGLGLGLGSGLAYRREEVEPEALLRRGEHGTEPAMHTGAVEPGAEHGYPRPEGGVMPLLMPLLLPLLVPHVS